jgi:hypothetical protein
MSDVDLSIVGEDLCVLPLKNGLWKCRRMTPSRVERWRRAWKGWWDRKGVRLAISPEMWRRG